MQIVWTKEAQEDLENIYRFWASKNEPYPTRLYNSLIDEAEALRRFPEIGVLGRFLTHRRSNFGLCLQTSTINWSILWKVTMSSYMLYGTVAAILIH